MKSYSGDHTKKLATVEMVVDKMHIKGHTDPWCRQYCDLMRLPALAKVCNIQLHLTLFNVHVPHRLILKHVSSCFHGSQEMHASHKK